MKRGIGFQPMRREASLIHRQDADATFGISRRFFHSDSLRRSKRKTNRGLRGFHGCSCKQILFICVIRVIRGFIFS
jgi:hypothetical protein